MNLRIPKADQAPDGGMARYVLIVEGDEEDPAAVAVCTLPNTAKAMAYFGRAVGHGQAKPSVGPEKPDNVAFDEYTPQPLPTFYAATTTDGRVSIHFDPWLLDSAATGSPRWNAQLLNTALHEAAHLAFPDHTVTFNFGKFGPIYADPPYSYLTIGPQSCIKYPS